MEIIEYLRVGDLRGRWLALVVAVPVLAGLAAFLLGAATPARYEASGRMALTGIVAEGTTARDVTQRAEVRFESVFESPQLAAAVTADLGRDDRHRPTSFTARPAGDGMVDLKLRADDDAAAAAALDLAARSALRVLLEAERGFEQARAGAATAAAEEAQRGLDELHAGLGVADAATSHARLTTEVMSLERRAETAADAEQARVFGDLLAARQAEHLLVGDALVTYWRWSDSLDRANAEATDANQRLAEVDAELARLDRTPSVLLLARTTPTSQLTQTALLAIVAMGSAGMMALAAFGLARRRSPNR
jgi:hypothetical protein